MENSRTLPTFLTPKQLAKLYGVHINTVYRWVSDGLPGERIGPRNKRYRLEAVEAWLREKFGTTEPRSAANE